MVPAVLTARVEVVLFFKLMNILFDILHSYVFKELIMKKMLALMVMFGCIVPVLSTSMTDWPNGGGEGSGGKSSSDSSSSPASSSSATSTSQSK